MSLDKQALFSSAQAITADAASTNVIDTGATADVGPGNEIELLVQVIQAFNTLTSLTVSLQTSTDEAFTSPIELVSQTLLLASLTAGANFSIRCVPNGAKRYLRLYYDVGGSNPSQGTITAGVVVDKQANAPVAIS